MAKITRVERFREYREEIQRKYSDQDATTKQKTSERVQMVLQNNENLLTNSSYGNEISFDDVMGAYEIYDKGNEYVSPLVEKAKRRRNYILLAFIVIGLLAIICVVSGILYFGGFVK